MTFLKKSKCQYAFALLENSKSFKRKYVKQFSRLKNKTEPC